MKATLQSAKVLLYFDFLEDGAVAQLGERHVRRAKKAIFLTP
jgi:hypothetical protein